MKQWYASVERPNPAGWDGTGFPRAERTLTARLRGLLALAVCLCLTLPLLPAPAQAAATPEGNWTDYAQTAWYNDASNSFTISTAAELAGLAKLVNDGNTFQNKTITLTASIDLSDHYWISWWGPDLNVFYPPEFKGTFDGGGHTVSHVVQVPETVDSEYRTFFGGLFGYIDEGGSILNLRIYDWSIQWTGNKAFFRAGGIAGHCRGELKNCVVEKANVEITMTNTTRTDYSCYVGGLVGLVSSSSKVENSAVIGISGKLTTSSNTLSNAGIRLCGLGSQENKISCTFNNCFVSGAQFESLHDEAKIAYFCAGSDSNEVNNCYWVESGLVEKEPAPKRESYPVNAEQIAGTSTAVIGEGYAKTPSLVTALNNWVGAQAGSVYEPWSLSKSGAPTLSIFIPDYIDISGPLDEVTHQSATGDIDVGMDLEGQVQENVTLLSVTLPASIPFIVDVDGGGAFKRVLSATGTLTNRSDTGVNITLTAVTDEGKLLDKVALSLVPDPAPTADTAQIALAAGKGKTDLLAALAAPAAGVPTTATVKVDGTDKLNGAPIGTDGEAFVVGLTLKVSQQ